MVSDLTQAVVQRLKMVIRREKFPLVVKFCRGGNLRGSFVHPSQLEW